MPAGMGRPHQVWTTVEPAIRSRRKQQATLGVAFGGDSHVATKAARIEKHDRLRLSSRAVAKVPAVSRQPNPRAIPSEAGPASSNHDDPSSRFPGQQNTAPVKLPK